MLDNTIKDIQDYRRKQKQTYRKSMIQNKVIHGQK